eukprot:6187834-Pleurochrysis_carterae.AAC.1
MDVAPRGWIAPCAQALDSDVGRVRSSTERQLTALASFVDGNKAKLLQCAQAIEKQWTNGKARALAFLPTASRMHAHTQHAARITLNAAAG